MYEFERVVNGLVKYIDNEIYPQMNDLQEFAARVLVGRVIQNGQNIKNNLINNGYIRTFGIIDEDGMVDVEGLGNDIKRELSRKGKVTLTVPMFGKLSFTPTDVDVLYKTIKGEAQNEDN